MNRCEYLKIFLELAKDMGVGKISLNRECVLNLIEPVCKAIPLKPIIKGDRWADSEREYPIWECPNCNSLYALEYEKYEYCNSCGQHIFWGNNENE